MILIDTNVIVQSLVGDSNTITALEKIEASGTLLSASVITKMEMLRGASNKNELAKLKKQIKTISFVQLNANISSLATDLIEKYFLSDHLEIPDALIAATALYLDIELYTYNQKDFKNISGLKLYDWQAELG
ncbi:MAG: type II toxin-antitoxin system VapC family toxin [Bacteroidota bacterium]